ncbi:MAG: TerC/Alx family metal homeostasis membrane protein [Ginsengibacter sp.]
MTYLIFGVVLFLAVILDLGLLSKKSKQITIRKAFYQTSFWIGLALAFFLFIWFQEGEAIALEYISAYLMEWSLSIDNIFVFILIFSYFGIKKEYYGRVLLLGILMAIILRIIFITLGIALVSSFTWILYLFGAFLIYTGIKMFFVEEDKNFDPETNKVYMLIKKILPLTNKDAGGKYTVLINGKKYFTILFVVIIMLATTDIVFALDSIPAVFAITQNKMVIYTSNIFAVLGLRSLFFLLRGAVSKFDYLQQGIAIVLIFVGTKMLVEYFNFHIPTIVSLVVIVFCLTGSIIFSLFNKKPNMHNEYTNHKHDD